ncbi:hypothetical protein [Streptacidiphilus anmyonensis]|uniref:hypothetical protein n=1 Tax=Streptacidiphilus anmyonensis TaxID=405782 RepID=UPI0005A98342|nr:hypothetical protein [Streptacidiphilus anmyonensis]
MSSTSSVENVHRVTKGALLTVQGRTHAVDLVGDTSLGYDPAVLEQYRAGVVSTVPLLVRADACDGAGMTVGEVTWVMDPERVPPAGFLSAVVPGQPFPAVQEYLLHVHVTIPDLLPGITLRNAAASGPVILRNSNAVAFPPANDEYELVQPVGLEDAGNPGPLLATIERFPTIVNPLR